MKVCAIAAVSKNGVIGNKGKLPWDLPADLRRFKRLTVNKPVIMGRATFESIGKPLPNRINIVVSSSDSVHDGVRTVRSVEDAIELAKESAPYDADEIMVIGGQLIYAEALRRRLVDKLYMTMVNRDVEGDTYFPLTEMGEAKWEKTDWSQVDEMIFVTYDKVD